VIDAFADSASAIDVDTPRGENEARPCSDAREGENAAVAREEESAA
jgi:hypothetical protein